LPRFFFHIFDDAWLLDGEGEELPDVAAAIARGHRIALELLEDVEANWDRTYIEIAEENGDVVARVRLIDEQSRGRGSPRPS
jgi:hypothetical protein